MHSAPRLRWKFASVVCVALAAVSMCAGPSLAADDAKSVGLVMSKLPPHGSGDYKALRKLAGKATGQALKMTGAEVWNVQPERVEALLAAAAAKGVVVTRLDATWNHALAPMDKNAAMTPEQSSMMSKSMGSKAAMGMSMMALPQAGVMEYALTKDMESSTSRSRSHQTLVIPLNATTSVTARRTSVKAAGDGLIWHGAIEGTGEPVTLMWWPGNRLSGSVTYKGHVYAIKSMGGAIHGVVEMSPGALPPEHAPATLDQMKKMNMTRDPLVGQGDASRMMDAPSKTDSIGPERGDTRTLEDAPLKGAKRSNLGASVPHLEVPKAGKSARGKRSRWKAPAPVTISLLVAYTKQAASYYSDIRTDLVALAVEEANQSLVNSGIGHVRLEIAGTHETDYVEQGSHFDHVFAMLQPRDGVLDDIPKVRDALKADVAVLVVHDPQGCGLAAKVAAEADKAFAVVHHECAATSYSLAHEVGHIIGARHDLALDDSADPFPHGHGFVHGTAWRTMMSYKESCDGCPRLPVWSNPNVKIKGIRAGDARSNNARVIAEQAARVAAFR